MTQKQALAVNAVIWVGTAIGSLVASLLGIVPWDGYLHLPIWAQLALGLALGSAGTAAVYFGFRDRQ